MRSWKERQRLDFRERDRPGYKRPDAGKKRDRRGYKRPDAGKRPKTHRGATGSSISRKKRGNKQSTGRATHNQRMKREGAFIVKEEQEEEKKGDRGGYKRPDAGKRPKTHGGATGCSRRKSGGNKKSTGRATHNQRMKREGAFIVNEEQEEEPAIRAGPCLQDQFTSKETEEEK